MPHNDEFVYVGKEAFADSIVEHVDLFDSVTSIGAEAFRNCAQLKEITIPASVTEIGENAFTGTAAPVSINIAVNPNSILPFILLPPFTSCMD